MPGCRHGGRQADELLIQVRNTHLKPMGHADLVLDQQQAVEKGLTFEFETRRKTSLRIGEVDLQQLVAFGRPFIANPDLVSRLQHELPLTTPDMSTFYTPGAKGYSDYPHSA
jgi:2,4-dienoyl-CoA reductase-like NADH-dependent reductase (Old Yellow Enzyme family)